MIIPGREENSRLKDKQEDTEQNLDHVDRIKSCESSKHRVIFLRNKECSYLKFYEALMLFINYLSSLLIV